MSKNKANAKVIAAVQSIEAEGDLSSVLVAIKCLQERAAELEASDWRKTRNDKAFFKWIRRNSHSTDVMLNSMDDYVKLHHISDGFTDSSIASLIEDGYAIQFPKYAIKHGWHIKLQNQMWDVAGNTARERFENLSIDVEEESIVDIKRVFKIADWKDAPPSTRKMITQAAKDVLDRIEKKIKDDYGPVSYDLRDIIQRLGSKNEKQK